MPEDFDLLLSAPPAALKAELRAGANFCHVDSDPAGTHLGSGGGTAYLLAQSCKAAGGGASFGDWMAARPKMIIHGSGQSRRLPAYAAEGKPMMPLPILPGIAGQRHDQTLLDCQAEDYGRVLRHAPPSYRLMVACGDVLVRNSTWMPRYPEADVLIVGLEASAEEAKNHGVMFVKRGAPNEIAFFLQKPSVGEIAKLAPKHSFLLDTGMWLLSQRAVDVLMRKCGWDPDGQRFRNGVPDAYELFDRFGEALGKVPSSPDDDVSSLTSAVLPLTGGRFYHFGTNRSVFASLAQLSHPAENRRAFGHSGKAESPRNRVILNSKVDLLIPEEIENIWIENSCIPSTWTFAGCNVITGVGPNSCTVNIPHGVCVDIMPMQGTERAALRVYGFDDAFKGSISDASTAWQGRVAQSWFDQRGIALSEAGVDEDCDIQYAKLFPLIDRDSKVAESLFAWMVAKKPERNDEMRDLWLNAERVSAAEIAQRGDVARRARDRVERMRSQAMDLGARRRGADGGSLDFEALAQSVESCGGKLSLPPCNDGSIAGVHLSMLNARLGNCDASESFRMLRDIIVSDSSIAPVSPKRSTLEDQIVWARSSARLDIAGGWTDTPPYCIEHGGKVVNMAVDLGGQPPIQVFARVGGRERISLHSIDLGVGLEIENYEDLAKEGMAGGFGIACAALRLAGFDPRFNADGGYASLKEQLREEFGGGIELSMLAAIPKGSGLGTSSILSGAILGALGNLCGLNWSEQDIYSRVSALEQMLSSGGGWQDQVGGLSRGIKIIETAPGITQSPELRWLPDSMVRDAIADGRALLYYTGLTRVARNILGEIVRGIFLNDRRRIGVIEEIGANASYAADALQRQDWEDFRESVRRSWHLNQALDSGTNPPEVARIVSRVSRWSPALKLLGAGGGGYMMILAGDRDEAMAMRGELSSNPTNDRVRFVGMSISDTGLQITRS